MLTATVGVERSCASTTVSPLGNAYFSNGMRIAPVLAAGFGAWPTSDTPGAMSATANVAKRRRWRIPITIDSLANGSTRGKALARTYLTGEVSYRQAPSRVPVVALHSENAAEAR